MKEHRIYSEKELLALIASGNEEAFRQLFDAYQRKLFTYVFRITESREAAEDTVQDIFLKIWNMRKNLPTVENINAYLHRMAHNYAYDGFKKLARESLVLAALRKQEIIYDQEPEDELISKEVKLSIQRIIDQLTPQQRKVFLMSREEGLKQEEIAQRLNISLSTVKKHMGDALHYLRQEIGQSYGAQAIAIYIIFSLTST